MKTTRKLHELGQRLWLDNITRGLLTSGTLLRYISEFSVTGLTSNPTIFDKAIGEGGSYDAAIRRKTAEGKSGEALFFELALEDLTQAADLFRPVHDATGGRQHQGCGGALPAGEAAQSVHQDSGHARRRASDRGVDLRRRADQRDAALLARAVSCGG